MTCVALTLGGTGALAADADTQYDLVPVDSPAPGTASRFADRLTVGDVTGDGITDVFAYAIAVDGAANAGKVVLINGATQEIEYELTSPDVEAGADFGFFISVPGDVNGDGLDDLAVGTNDQDVDGNVDAGRMYVFDGPTGDLIHRIDNPYPQAQARFGSRIGSAGDFNDDGFDDFIVRQHR